MKVHVLDTRAKFGSLDDQTSPSSRSCIQGGIVDRRAFRRNVPYKVVSREKNGFSRPPFRPLPQLCNNCRRTGHFGRDCPNAPVCNNCGISGHIAAGCPKEPLCRNCKKPGHIASKCHKTVCNMCGKLGHIAKACPAQDMGLPKSRLCNHRYRPGYDSVDWPNESSVCKNCCQSGHLAPDCWNSPVCNGCSHPDHIARDCARGAVDDSRPTGPFTNQPGHKSKDCNQPGQRSEDCNPPGHKIKDCNEPGHTSKNCLQVVLCDNCDTRGHIAVECPCDPKSGRGGWLEE